MHINYYYRFKREYYEIIGITYRNEEASETTLQSSGGNILKIVKIRIC